MFLKRDTYQQQLDLKYVQEMKQFVDSWIVTDQLLSAASTNTTGTIMMIKVGPALEMEHVVYPQQMLPMLNKDYEKDIQENMIFGNVIQFKKVDTTNNAFPVCTASAAVTSTNAGFLPEGFRVF
jgi:hypothetical protein